MHPITWLVISVILILIEVATAGLTTIWFAGGALVGMILSLVGASLPVQVFAAILVSFGLLFFTRPAVAKLMKKGIVKTNVDAVIGRPGVVTETVTKDGRRGRAVVDGQDWSARSETGEEIPKDTAVTVIAVRGVKLIVAPNKEEKTV